MASQGPSDTADEVEVSTEQCQQVVLVKAAKLDGMLSAYPNNPLEGFRKPGRAVIRIGSKGMIYGRKE
jgi:hypothetical protein